MRAITVFVFILVSSISFSQSGWQVMFGGYSETYYPYYSSTYFPNELTGYIMGRKFYKKTTDGGATWNRTDSIGSSSYYFLNSQTAWISGNSGLYFTSNGGNNWSISNSPSNAISFCYLNLSTGYSCGLNGSIYKTLNGGVNWIQLNSGVNDKLNSIFFMNSNYGVCAGDWGTILTTTNGGNNWLRYVDNNMGFFTRIFFIDQQTGFVCGTGDNIFRTTNAGLNWQQIYTGYTDLVTSFFFTGQNTGYMFGSYGSNFKTTNGGLSWSSVSNNNYLGKIYGVSSASGNTFWCVADTGTVYKSINEGLSWELVMKQFITYDNLNCVHFINSVTGFIGSNSGKIFRTTNSGISWQKENLNTTYNIKGILFRNSSTGFICCGDGIVHGAIFRTTNGGANWNTVYQDTASLNSLFFINDYTGWSIGRFAAILKTTNSGLNWSTYKHQVYYTAPQEVWFTDENTGYLAGTSPLFKSTNGGINWFSMAGTVNATRIQFINSATGYFTSSNGNNLWIYKTTNSGLNWDYNLIGTGSGGDMCFTNEQSGWIGGLGIKATSNGGQNWYTQINLNYSTSVNSFHFLNSNEGWAVGNTGTILKTVNGGIGITTISSEIPKLFYLFQNYPNPFNPTTKIKFSVPLSRGVAGEAGRGVLLKVYDVLGKEIAVLVNENLRPGIYEIEWDAANIPSGVYFYSLVTNEFTQTKKMVVLK